MRFIALTGPRLCRSINVNKLANERAADNRAVAMVAMKAVAIWPRNKLAPISVSLVVKNSADSILHSAFCILHLNGPQPPFAEPMVGLKRHD